MTTVVARLHAEFRALADLLSGAGEPSLLVTADDCFRKALLLSAASHFETIVTEAIVRFFEESSSNNERVIEFVRRKALTRQYHTLFDWEAKNANRFFAFFGNACRTSFEEKCKTEPRFDAAMSAFLEVGRERNRLVHQNFGAFSLEKTAEEIFELYSSAEYFVGAIQDLLRGYAVRTSTGTDAAEQGSSVLAQPAPETTDIPPEGAEFA